MTKSLSSFVAGLLIGVLVATVGFATFLRIQRSEGGGQTVQKVLKLGHGLDTNHPVHLAMEEMKSRLEALSAGSMTIDIYPSGVLGSETECIEQLQNGSLAMTKTSAGALESFVPSMAVFSLPYVFRDETHFHDVLASEVGQELLAAGETKYLRGLCYYDAGSRNFYAKSKPIRTPEDLQGMKIRVMNSATAIEMIKAMGGAPTPIAYGELYSALAQGTVDGAENNAPSFISNKHYEVCKHFSLDGHTIIPDVLLMSLPVWNQLTSQQQQWLQQAANESAVFQRTLWRKETYKALERAAEEGVDVYVVDSAAFAAKVQPMLQSVSNTEMKALLDRIGKVK